MTDETRLWGEVGDRLDRLATRNGRAAGFWLRDDDAVHPTPALDRLIGIAAAAGAPLALAVIPAGAEPSLAARLAPLSGVAVLQHGFSHGNHAPSGDRKTELGDHRPPGLVLADLMDGSKRLRAFPHLLPVLVPPWNRIGAGIAAGLSALGFRGLSLFGDRRGNPAAPGLVHFNTHLDLVAWKPARRFQGRETALSLLAGRLDALLSGAADPDEPTGILIHHLVHDGEAFAFLADLLGYLAGRRDCRFLSAADLLDRAEGRKAM